MMKLGFAALALLVGWYLLDGRYEYRSQGETRMIRIDRLTGDTVLITR